MIGSTPATSGKVIISTTHGDLDVELYCNECPKTTKNFIQLCLAHRYDNCNIFKIIPQSFIVTGDPTNSGEGGEAYES